MKQFGILSVVTAAVLVLLQFGGNTYAATTPAPILPPLPQQPLSPAPAPPSQGCIPPGLTPGLTPGVTPGYNPYLLPPLPAQFRGLYDQTYINGKGNIDFTGIDILGNLNLPANVLSLTDILNNN